MFTRPAGAARTPPTGPSRCGTAHGRGTARARPLPPSASPPLSAAGPPPSCRRSPPPRCRYTTPPPGTPGTPCDARWRRSTPPPAPVAPAAPTTSAARSPTRATPPAPPRRPPPSAPGTTPAPAGRPLPRPTAARPGQLFQVTRGMPKVQNYHQVGPPEVLLHEALQAVAAVGQRHPHLGRLHAHLRRLPAQQRPHLGQRVQAADVAGLHRRPRPA